MRLQVRLGRRQIRVDTACTEDAFGALAELAAEGGERSRDRGIEHLGVQPLDLRLLDKAEGIGRI